MSLPTLKSVCAEIGAPEKLVRAVVRQLGGWNADTAQNCRDIDRFGIGGGFSGFIYYADTVAFFKLNKKSIMKLAKNDVFSLGEKSVLSFFASFNCIKTLDISEEDLARAIYQGKGEMTTQIFNCLAWYAAETVAREIDDYLGENLLFYGELTAQGLAKHGEKKMKYQIEYTDTFGGEANYSWVDRHIIDLPDNASGKQIRRAAKKAAGLSGVRGVWSDYGGELVFRPYRMCTILFAMYYAAGAQL